LAERAGAGHAAEAAGALHVDTVQVVVRHLAVIHHPDAEGRSAGAAGSGAAVAARAALAAAAACVVGPAAAEAARAARAAFGAVTALAAVAAPTASDVGLEQGQLACVGVDADGCAATLAAKARCRGTAAGAAATTAAAFVLITETAGATAAAAAAAAAIAAGDSVAAVGRVIACDAGRTVIRSGSARGPVAAEAAG
jgi:hypothetical protein